MPATASVSCDPRISRLCDCTILRAALAQAIPLSHDAIRVVPPAFHATCQGLSRCLVHELT
jgi:hypothetical protein